MNHIPAFLDRRPGPGRTARGFGLVGALVILVVLAGIGLGVFHFRTSHALRKRGEAASADLDRLTNVRGVPRWTLASLRQRALEILGQHDLSLASDGDLKVEGQALTLAAVRQLPRLLRTQVDLACQQGATDRRREARVARDREDGGKPRTDAPAAGCDDAQLEALGYALVRVQVEVKLKKAWVTVPFRYDHQYLIEQTLAGSGK